MNETMLALLGFATVIAIIVLLLRKSPYRLWPL